MISLNDRSGTVKDHSIPDKDLAAIHELCRRTFQANLIGAVQSDCPGRERLGYGGDLVATLEAYMLNFDMREIYLKILRDFADEAADDGWITETAPHVGLGDRGFGGRAGPISWALAVPELIEGLLRHYDEKRALEFYPVCARYVRLVDAACPDGMVPKCIGDHEAIERAPDEVTATAHYYRFVTLTASFARRLKLEEEAKFFEGIAEKTRKAFVRSYVKDGIVANGTQSAQAIGLYLGLVPAEQRDKAFKRLVAAVEEKRCAPYTGIFSTRYMLLALSENGRVDLARKVVLHRGFPGWLHMLERGATTLWETWRESDNIFSNCHPMFGSVDEWILKYGGGSR
jgi:alpha-L-rhamnosidase